MSIMQGKGSFRPSEVHPDDMTEIKKDVILAVNLLMLHHMHTQGKEGIHPAKSYNLVYDKTKGRVYVEIWKGDKWVAKLFNKVQRYTPAEICSEATAMTGGTFERFRVKETIF